jgi:hypothetical protein
MDILNIIMNARDGAAARHLGSQFGLDEAQTASAISSLIPALTEGFQRNVRTPEGLAGLASALSGGQHQQYLEDPSTLTTEAAASDGNGILGHLFGSKEVSREVASRAASQTGVGVDILKRMLPLVASMAMGAVSQQRSAGGAQSPSDNGGLANLVTPLLDRDRDGSIADDVGDFVTRMFKRS